MTTATKKKTTRRKSPARTAVDRLDWKYQGIKSTKRGQRVLLTAEPDQKFWVLWGRYKDKQELQYLGVSVTPYDGDWQVCRWLTVGEYELMKSPLEKPKRLKNRDGLGDFQIPHIEKLVSALRQNGAVLDGSDVGMRKTSSAMAVARELNLRPMVLCPKTVKSVWRKWAKHIGIELEGVDTYEKLRMGNTSILDRSNGKRGKVAFEWNLDQSNVLIFDECHKLRGEKTLNGAMLIAARKQGIPIMLLSATAAESPKHLKAMGYALGLFDKPSDYWNWAMAHGCRKVMFGERYRVPVNDPRYYKSWLEFIGESSDPEEQAIGKDHLQSLHRMIFEMGRGARLTVDDDPNFPKNHVAAESYEMATATKIQKVYDETLKKLQKLLEQAQGDDDEEESGNALTIILRARQLVEYLKVDAFVELAENAVEEGKSVALFVNFKDTLAALAEKLKTDCLIHGGQKEDEREKLRQKFQSDESRIIICNIGAGGVGMDLHDLNGKYPRQSFVSPGWSALEIIQALGRTARSGAKTAVVQRVVYAADTVEEEVCLAVQKKIGDLKTLNDGDVRPGGFDWL